MKTLYESILGSNQVGVPLNNPRFFEALHDVILKVVGGQCGEFNNFATYFGDDVKIDGKKYGRKAVINYPKQKQFQDKDKFFKLVEKEFKKVWGKLVTIKDNTHRYDRENELSIEVNISLPKDFFDSLNWKVKDAYNINIEWQHSLWHGIVVIVYGHAMNKIMFDK